MTVRGTVSSTVVGRETWVGDRHLGYLKRDNFLAPGRWRAAAPECWEFVLDQREHADELDGAPELEVLDGYWGEEAIPVFGDRLARIFDDPDHSVSEPRELIVGHCARRLLLVVCFVQRGNRIRIFSARRATRQERRDYEEGISQT